MASRAAEDFSTVTDLADLLVRKLRPGGRLHCATDWEDYAEQMWDVRDATAGLVNRAGPRGSVPRPDWRPQTHFETRGQKLGHGVWDLLYDRTCRSPEDAAPHMDPALTLTNAMKLVLGLVGFTMAMFLTRR
ncbi:hypothetical protein G6F24_015213 [Rhizopus arrhizus]|nr:hypothetical protein G6F24_015213 [Rhizopus arrhizus]